jgi:hypothetical protein
LRRLHYIKDQRLEWVAASIRTHADVWCLSAGLVALSWVLQSHIDFNISDEGFLWYGSWRVSHGEVPIRDFNSYDPGRYYWCALWSLLFGDGILGVRAGVALFQVIGLAFGLFAARRVIRERWQISLVAVLLFAWMWPRNKLFDSALAMCAVFIGTRLIEKPSPRRLWQTGAYIGLAAFFGRNHGLYSLIGTLGIIIVLVWQGKQRLFRSFAHLFCGILVGCLPVFFLVVVSRGFGSAYVESVQTIVNRGATNTALPVPWPWTVQIAGQDWLTIAHQLLLGLSFVVAFVLPALAIVLIMRRPSWRLECQPLFCAAAFMSAAYAHHASVRSDVSHLTEAIHPALLGILALIATYDGRAPRFVKAAAAITLAVVSVFVPAIKQPIGARIRRPDLYVQTDVRGDRLWTQRYDATVLGVMRDHIAPDLQPEEQVFFAPNMSGLYAALGRRSPVWDIYPILLATSVQQQRMIEELERAKIKYAIINDAPLDGNDSLRFCNTHPAVWSFLTERFELTDNKSILPNYIIFSRKP